MTTRKIYPKEFKLDAISLVLELDYTRSEAANSLGLNANILGLWKKEHPNDDGQAFRGNEKLTPEQEKIRKLKSKVKRLEIDKDHIKYMSMADFSYYREIFRVSSDRI